MKNDKKMFILIEVILGVVLIALVFVMLRGINSNAPQKISVVIPNSDDNQWAAFKYGLKMAAEDQKMELFVVSTDSTLTAEEQKNIIDGEIDNGAAAVILLPVQGMDVEKTLKKIQKKIPVMLVEYTPTERVDAFSIPTVKSDNYAMGLELAEELLKDYNGKIDGKTFGIFSESGESESVNEREKGFREALKASGAKIVWTLTGFGEKESKSLLETQEKVDFVIALDDNSLTAAGECSASNNLYGALVYGIGNSTEAVYYLDSGVAKCLVVPDEFSVGYQSLAEIADFIGQSFYTMKNRIVSHTVIRRDALFLKENQEIIYTMSQ